MGFTLVYLLLVVLIPLSTLFWKSASLGPAGLLAGRERAARRGLLQADVRRLARGRERQRRSSALIVTWVLVRYRFPGRRLVDALVDFPFALPTAVAGIASRRSTPRTAGSARRSSGWA